MEKEMQRVKSHPVYSFATPLKPLYTYPSNSLTMRSNIVYRIMQLLARNVVSQTQHAPFHTTFSSRPISYLVAE